MEEKLCPSGKDLQNILNRRANFSLAAEPKRYSPSLNRSAREAANYDASARVVRRTSTNLSSNIA
jgi:hypothetical protein